jgi:hypothetical protein
MSRTRGASGNFDYSDDGELLGKGGQPIITGPIQRVTLDRQGNAISPAAYTMAAPRALSGGTTLRGPGAEPVPEPAAIVGYKADFSTFSRNMEAYELAKLLEMMLGELVIRVTPEVFNTLSGDLRRHFLPVRAMDMPPPEEEEAAEDWDEGEEVYSTDPVPTDTLTAAPGVLAAPPKRPMGWPKGKPRKPVLPPFPVATPDDD